MNNIINKEIEVKVDNFWKVFKDLKKGDINKEIVRCNEIYKNCEGEFKDEKEEEYIFTDTDIDDTIDVLQSPTRQTRILNVCKQRWARLTRLMRRG